MASTYKAEIRLKRESMLAFREAARSQGFCAVCGDRSDFDAHHVVAQQELKARGRHGDLWDARNALRLCSRFTDQRCHAQHEVKRHRVLTKQLTDENICFVFYALGAGRGGGYLARHYSGIDRRFTLHEEGRCLRCQLPPSQI